jgi:hypothetical protein
LKRREAGEPQRQRARSLGVPRSTLQRWEGAVPAHDPAVVAFFTSPAGLAFLHQLTVSAHVTITQRAAGGVRVVCEFLDLCGLSDFIGTSYGSQHGMNVAIEEAIVQTAAEQRCALAKETQAPRAVSLCEDETFHPATCLVALEPVSGFIVAEQYAADRTAATWTQVISAATTELNLEVIQSTSDEAPALRRHAQQDLNAHHSPDLFHVQHEAGKATGLTLARARRQGEREVEAAEQALAQERQAERAYHQHPHGPGRPPNFAQRIQAASQALGQAMARRDAANTRQQQARACLQELSTVYHPFELEHGQAQTPEGLAAKLGGIFQRLQAIAEGAQLSARACAHLEKAKRVTTQMVATLALVMSMLQQRVEAQNLPLPLEAVMLEQLIPARYLQRVAARQTRAEERHRLEALSERLLAPLRAPDHPFNQLDASMQATLEQVAGDCADLFQRSSSAVEGRNGQLSLFHHGRHRLSDRKLSALTAIHNFYIRRADGTTAAERLFGCTHASLFEEVLKRVPLPPPARRRRRSRRPSRAVPLMALAA